MSSLLDIFIFVNEYMKNMKQIRELSQSTADLGVVWIIHQASR